MRYLNNSRFFLAVATLVGMIIGAGTFGIPYVMAQAGFSVGVFYLLLIGAAVALVHLFYGEIILRTREQHRLVGYAKKYLGDWAKHWCTATVLVEYYGSLLAYIILGGTFFYALFGGWLGGSEVLWAIIFFLLATIAVFFGLKTVSNSEFILMFFLLLIVLFLFVRGCPLVKAANFTSIDLKNSFLPYGVILFAMAGSAAIPELRMILKGQEKKMKKAILWGTAIPVIAYLLFSFSVVGISGKNTSEEAINGLIPYLGKDIVILGSIFGILAIYTSFIILALGLQEMFHCDYKIPPKWGLLLVLAVPLILYFAGFQEFVSVIGFVGAVASGLDGIITILIYFKARKKGDRDPEYKLNYFRIFAGIILFIFCFGLFYKFIYLI